MTYTRPCTGLLLGSVLLLCASCIDDKILNYSYDPYSVQVELTLSLPGESVSATRAISTRVGGENQTYDSLDKNTTMQYYIGSGDVYALVYTVEGSDTTLYAAPTMTLQGNNGDETRLASGSIDRPDGEMTITVDVIANLVQNGYASTTTEAHTKLQTLIGRTREQVDEEISTFSYPTYADNEYAGWALQVKDEEGNITSTRYLPMWGKGTQVCKITSETEVADLGTCSMYRSVAKMGVVVSTEDFELKEVYIYYLNNEGKYVSSLYPDPSQNIQYTYPDVPTSTQQRGKQQPLIYRLDDYKVTWNAFLNQIYVTETDNKYGTQPMVMVVGGYYKGGDHDGEGLVDGESKEDKYTLNYYRIDMVDDGADNNPDGGTGPFDIIRNHSYIFNIKECANPGTSDPNPDYAAAGLTVEVLDYVDMPMHGINAQYTLTVNQSLFSFSGISTDVATLIVNTDGTGWEMVTDWDGDDAYPQAEDDETANKIPEWVIVAEGNDGNHTNVSDTVYIAVEANVNNDKLRNGSFWIKCGRILKRIDIVQEYNETANSYIVSSAGTYELKVNVRGNGNTQAWTTEEGTATVAIDFGLTDSIPNVAYVDIIWETADGFITIPDKYAISEAGSIVYEANNVSMGGGNWSGGNVFSPGNGANALIGVFNEANELVWSYHIWGVGDYADGEKTETWRVGQSSDSLYTYAFMDRNLGAYSNLPGSKSFGLLYQWGRKDPFVGAYRENYERDYRQVKRQYTKHYKTLNDSTYLWSNYDDTGTDETDDVKYTIAHPTTILEDGLLSDDHDTEVAHGLWGTTSYEYVNAETGNKTMYDPCPPGYRMPSLNALSIWDGENNLWYDGQAQHSYKSSRFVPVPDGSDFSTLSEHSADFVSDAPFYGFWLDLDAVNNPFFTGHDEDYLVNYYDWSDPKNSSCGWITGYENTKPTNVTWIPMAGILNGTINHFGRAGLTDVLGVGSGGGGPGGDFGGDSGDSGPPSGGGGSPFGVKKEANGIQTYDASGVSASGEGKFPASSLQVTSVLWANSPTPQSTDHPAGLLIHGTEGAYAPHHPDETGDLIPYYYSCGVVTNTTGSGTGTASMTATEGPGYWTTDSEGYSSEACGWWSGSVDAKESGMSSSIETGTWNATNDHKQYIDNNYNSTYWYDENGFNESGRHFHTYMEDDASTYANPSYAASVRCIRDKDEIVHKDNRILYVSDDGTTVSEYDEAILDLYQYAAGGEDAGKDCIELVVEFTGMWEVINPGAKWISVNPSSGSTTNSSGDQQTIKISWVLDTGVTLPEENTIVQIVIKYSNGSTSTINVKYVGGVREY